MIFEIRELSDRMCEAHRRGSSLILLFDYDGTLTPIVERPSMAVLDRRIRQLLSRLNERPRVHVGVLSGRELADLQLLLNVPNLYLAGTGGMELDLHGLHVAHPDAGRFARLIGRLVERLQPSMTDFPGAWIERKRLAMTVHFRQMAETLENRLRLVVADAAREFADEIHVSPGPKALELSSARGWDKGMAIRLILADIGAANDILFYAGDGANDDAAMKEVTAMGGLTVGIGADAPRNTAWQLPNPMAIRTLLECLDASLEKPNRGPTWPTAGHSRRPRSKGENAAMPTN